MDKGRTHLRSEIDIYHLENVDRRLSAIEKRSPWPDAIATSSRHLFDFLKALVIVAGVAAGAVGLGMSIEFFFEESERATIVEKNVVMCANACGRKDLDYHEFKHARDAKGYEDGHPLCYCRPPDGSISKQIW